MLFDQWASYVHASSKICLSCEVDHQTTRVGGTCRQLNEWLVCVPQVGAWRDRLIICTGRQGPPAAAVKAFLDAGAKAVIVSSIEPAETLQQRTSGASDSLPMEKERDAATLSDAGRFVIADEEEDEEEEEPESPRSDWEDSDFEKQESHMQRHEVEEKELSTFLGALYDALFRQGLGAESALQLVLEAHPKQHYRCILPSV